MKRRKGLRRKKALKKTPAGWKRPVSTGKRKKRTLKRTADEIEAAGRPHPKSDRPFLQWVHIHLTCEVCGSKYPDPHHVATRGAGGRDPNNVIPLCRIHHGEWHTIGRYSFQAKYRLDAVFRAIVVWEQWQKLWTNEKAP